MLKIGHISIIKEVNVAIHASCRRIGADYLFQSYIKSLLVSKTNWTDVIEENPDFVNAVRDLTKGNGPIILEMITYRYSGHSMSDPGTTYRLREEIQNVRSRKDPIKLIHRQIVEAKFASEAELKEIDLRVKEEVDLASQQAQSDPEPNPSELYKHVYSGEYSGNLRGCRHD